MHAREDSVDEVETRQAVGFGERHVCVEVEDLLSEQVFANNLVRRADGEKLDVCVVVAEGDGQSVVCVQRQRRRNGIRTRQS